MEFKETFSNIESLGAEVLINLCLKNYDEALEEELFICDGLLNSVNDANGCPFVNDEGATFSHCKITKGSSLIAFFENGGSYIPYIVTEGGFIKTTL